MFNIQCSPPGVSHISDPCSMREKVVRTQKRQRVPRSKMISGDKGRVRMGLLSR
jgi:hypothetical protein